VDVDQIRGVLADLAGIPGNADLEAARVVLDGLAGTVQGMANAAVDAAAGQRTELVRCLYAALLHLQRAGLCTELPYGRRAVVRELDRAVALLDAVRS
jgi:hypothetical protein